jgi:type III pantothenate kinase
VLLTVDVGNTTVAAAVFRGSAIVFRGRLMTPRSWTARSFPALLPAPWRARVTAAAVSSVVPRLDRPILAAIRRACAVRPIFLDSRCAAGLPLRIDRPSELGADRIADCLGALALFPAPLVVIDSGTAITFDLVDRAGSYRGGCILPGVGVAIRALADHAARLRRVAFAVPRSPLGRNTADSIRAGIFYGYQGALGHLIALYRRRLGPRTTVVATGGMMGAFRGRVPGIDAFEPDLTFIGLRRFHERLAGRRG